MKKLILLTLLFSLVLTSVCFAKIEKLTNTFDGERKFQTNYTQNSGFLGMHQTTCNFIKTTKNYYVAIGTEVEGGRGNVSFAPTADIRIDGRLYQVYLDNGDWNGSAGYGEIVGTYKIPLEVVIKLKSANDVALRCNWSNGVGGNSTIYVDKIPDDKLKEWVQIIDMDFMKDFYR